MQFIKRRTSLAALGALFLPQALQAQKRSGPGVSDTEIRIGSTMPFSGPVSILGTLGKATQAYVSKLNAEGGINGRKIRLIQYDDGYNPGKALELTRKLVEQDEVLFIYQTVGTATNNAIHRYLNGRKVPHLLIFSGANKWADPANGPWTLSGMPSYDVEGRIYARWILQNMPNAKIAVLLQNDDFGRDYLAGIRAGLGERAKSMIVAEQTYETTDPTVESQVVSLKASGATVFISLSNGKFTVQSLRKAHDIEWKPQIFLPLGSASLTSIIRPAGPERAIGAITAAYNKAAADPQWDKDAGVIALREFTKQWMPDGDPNDQLVAGGYSSAQILTQILKQCGDDLTRENVMRQALSLRGFATPTMLPGLTLNTSPTDYELFAQLRLQRFNGSSWVPFGEIVSR